MSVASAQEASGKDVAGKDVAGKDAGPDGVDLDLGEMAHSAGFVLRIAQLSAFDRFFELLGETEVKISEFTVLLAVYRNPGVRQGLLADVLKIKWPNMTNLVRVLEGRGLIRRQVAPSDRRTVALHVTEAGRRAIDAVSARMYANDRAALSMLDDTEHAVLLGLLRKVAGWPPETKG